MLLLFEIGVEIARRRKALSLTQFEVCKRARVSRATLDALENGRWGELGFSKVTKILAALSLELRIHEAGGRRPTLDDLIEQNKNEENLNRSRNT